LTGLGSEDDMEDSDFVKMMKQKLPPTVVNHLSKASVKNATVAIKTGVTL